MDANLLLKLSFLFFLIPPTKKYSLLLLYTFNKLVKSIGLFCPSPSSVTILLYEDSSIPLNKEKLCPEL